MIAVGVLILYLAFVPGFQVFRDLLSTSVGKAAALAAIIYVHKKVSCSIALLLVVVYLRCTLSSWEGFTTPTSVVQPTCTCPDGYAYDVVSKECKTVSSMAGSVPPEATTPSVGAPTSMPAPPGPMGQFPVTTPTAPTNSSMPMPSIPGGVQPSTTSSSSVAPL
jgi:hypothetical protein